MILAAAKGMTTMIPRAGEGFDSQTPIATTHNLTQAIKESSVNTKIFLGDKGVGKVVLRQ
jgi:hypothetical protein